MSHPESHTESSALSAAGSSVPPAPVALSGHKRKGYRLRMAAREWMLEASLAARRLSGERMRPDLFIIGAQKAGTTTLHGHLARHPQALPPLVKEVHYFDVASHRPLGWYGAHFPKLSEAQERTRSHSKPIMTFDTTPYYIFHPDVAARVAAFAPNAKIIAVLRDPVARAWSHYWHEWGRGFEKLGPIEALSAESERLPNPHEHVGQGARERFAHQHYSYCSRSEYDRQIARWRQHFPAENILCLRSESLFTDPGPSLERVAAFLGIDPFPSVKPRVLNSGDYDAPPPEVALWLRERLAPSMAATRAMLGEEFTW